MYRPRTSQAAAPRRGIILLVVITLLTLFAVVGLTFALYAQGEADASRIFREYQDTTDDPTILFSWALGELIYDVPDNDPNNVYGSLGTGGVYSAIRGHSLARSIYGWNDAFNPSNPNTTPFCGTGQWHTGAGQWPVMNGLPGNVDDYTLPNFTFFQADGWIRDPEKLPPGGQPRTAPASATGVFAGGFNAPYTYPNENNMYLAAVNSQGQVLVPSFHRPWLYNSANPTDPLNDTTNPIWSINNPQGKYQILRPRPVDQLLAGETGVQQDPTSGQWVAVPTNRPVFPYPSDATGDVKNLFGAPGGNDSIWIDLNFPVRTLPDGRKYKPLFAFLVRDMDGLVNLNVHGNLRYSPTMASPAGGHASHQGWGGWEVSLAQVLKGDPGGTEWTQLLQNQGNPQNQQLQRYGNGQPGGGGKANPITMSYQSPPPPPGPPGVLPPWYGAFDYDASQGTTNNWSASKPLNDPTVMPPTNGTTFSAFPQFNQGAGAPGYNSSTMDPNMQPKWDELTNHPLLYNYYSPEATGDRRFGLANMKQLWYGYSNAANYDYTLSDLNKLIPTNVGNPKYRNLFTLLSADLDMPGMVPWVWDPSGAVPLGTAYAWPAPGANGIAPPPTPGPLAFPQAALRNGNPPNASEFSNDWRAVSALLGRLDLSRHLTDYPLPDATGVIQPASYPQLQQAVQDRQNFAMDIFTRLRTAVGAADPKVVAPGTDQFFGLQWLAQLAANIVDYIDDDDYITAFQWYQPDPTKVVYGTELPRLVINEFYAQVNNDPAAVTQDNVAKKATEQNYKFNVWMEFHNPMYQDGALSDNGAARLFQQGQMGQQGTPIYQIYVLNNANPAIRARENLDGSAPGTNGTPPNNPPTQQYMVVNFPQTPNAPDRVLPSNGAYAAQPALNSNAGFYVLAPDNSNKDVYGTTGTAPPENADDPNITFTAATPNGAFQQGQPSSSLTQNVPKANEATDPIITTEKAAVLLRRLACPALPPQTDPTKPLYNPYVTVDYADGLKVWDGRHWTSTGPNPPAPAGTFQDWVNPGPPPTHRYSVGRKEPYASDASQWQPQNPTVPQTGNLKYHTFFRHNAVEDVSPMLQPVPPLTPNNGNDTLTYPFHWMVHPERPLINPMELVHVSAYKPHELTQQFVIGAAPQPQHTAPWRNQDSRLYRFLELVECQDRAAGAVIGGRSAGKININTIYDLETFMALCDPQASNSFQATDVTNPGPQPGAWEKLTQQRSPGLSQNPPTITQNDKPFISLGTGHTAAGSTPAAGQDIGNTVLNPGMFNVAGASPQYPYLQTELLTKIFGNLTTRSNVFAVWCTVGYFEVTDTTTLPVKLGVEIGSTQGTTVRHRMFAIVDRTNLTIDPLNGGQRLQGPAPWWVPSPSQVQSGNNQPQTFVIPRYYEGFDLSTVIQAGSTSLVIDTGNPQDVASPQEKVAVTGVAVDANNNALLDLQAVFQNAHGPNFRVTNVGASTTLGNPGPQANFDYRKPLYAPVVRFFALLD